MKVSVYLNKIPTPTETFDYAHFYLYKHGVELEYSFHPIDLTVSRELIEGPQGKIYGVTHDGIADTNADITIFVLDGAQFPKTQAATSTSFIKNGIITNLVVYSAGEYTKHTLAHELMHCLFKWLLVKHHIVLDDPMDSFVRDGKTYIYYKNDFPDAPDGNYAEAWNRLAPYLYLMSPYKYFKPTESTGRGHTVAELNPNLVYALDKARELAGVPFVITSGYRTMAENIVVGGVSNSAHTKGQAADLLTKDNTARFKILYGLLNCGHPLFIEICKSHIHVDICSDIHALNQAQWSNDD